MNQPVYEATGYRADWLNAWLAAIGITVAVDGTELSWSNDPVPHARFQRAGEDFPARIHEHLPTLAQLASSPIARHRDGYPEFPRTVTLNAYRGRVPLERAADEPSLSVSVTDLIAPHTKGQSEDDLPHAAFDVTVPKGITLWQRVSACRGLIAGPDMVADSLSGRHPRVKTNGLGFDITRIPSRGDVGANLVDPVLEVLAFLALTLFPTRGNGRSATTRGWSDSPSRRGAFKWATWHRPRDRWAIDAWLDRYHAGRELDQPANYQTVPYRPVKSDRTRGYASETVS